MSVLEQLAPIALILIAVWFILWSIREVFQIKNPIVTGVMVICAFIGGLLLFLTH